MLKRLFGILLLTAAMAIGMGILLTQPGCDDMGGTSGGGRRIVMPDSTMPEPCDTIVVRDTISVHDTVRDTITVTVAVHDTVEILPDYSCIEDCLEVNGLGHWRECIEWCLPAR